MLPRQPAPRASFVHRVQARCNLFSLLSCQQEVIPREALEEPRRSREPAGRCGAEGPRESRGWESVLRL